MEVSPITETTGLAIAMKVHEARALQAELASLGQSPHFINDLNRRIEAVLGPIEEPPF